MKRTIFHHPLIVSLLFSMLISMTILPVEAQTSDDFIEWLRTHQDSGGTYTLKNDIILENHDYDDADSQILNPYILINTNGYSITLTKGTDLRFLNDNIHFVGNSTIFYLQDNASIQFLSVDSNNTGKTPNSIYSKHGPVIQLSNNSELFIDGHTAMQADHGAAIISRDNGFVNLENTTIHGNPAIQSDSEISLRLCEINGRLIASKINSALSILHDNPQSQETYSLLYDSIFIDADRSNKTLYANAVVDDHLQDMLPQYVKAETCKLDNSGASDDVVIPLTYQNLPTLTTADIGKTITVTSTLAFTEFQQNLIKQGIIDPTNINPPQIKIQVMQNELQFGISFENRYILCADINFNIPPNTFDPQIRFEVSEDGIHWFTAIRSGFNVDYSSYDAFVALVDYADHEGNELRLQYNHTYQFRMHVLSGQMKGTSTSLIIKITKDILGQTFYNPSISLPPVTLPPIHQPDQALPDDDESIDGNRGGGGQNEGTREHTNTASATSSQANKTQGSKNQSNAESNDDTAKLQSSNQDVKCGTDTNKKSTFGDMNYLLVVCIVLGAVIVSGGIGYLLYKRKKGV